jgi:CDK-activating kinase assembly factor MAT1
LQIQQTPRGLRGPPSVQRLPRGGGGHQSVTPTEHHLPSLTTHSAFNLINDQDLPETEARIAKYRAENAALIALNQQREQDAARLLAEQEAAARAERTQRADAARREAEDATTARAQERAALIDTLETSDADAGRLAARARADARKRRAAAAEHTFLAQRGASVLRARAAQSRVPDAPHVPLDDAYESAYAPRAEGYDDPVSAAVRRDAEGIMRAGGYRVEEAWERALRSAVASLSVAPLSGLPGEELSQASTSTVVA